MINKRWATNIEKAQIEIVVKEPTKKLKRLKKVTPGPPVINCELFANVAAIYQEENKKGKGRSPKLIKEKNKK